MQPRLLPALLLLLVPGVLGAQTVRGRLLGGDGGEPVAGARVLLRGAQGQAVAAANTDGSGGFQLSAPSAGSYTLLAERIGYAPTLSPPLQLGAGQTLEYTLRANPERVSLEGIVVRGGGGGGRSRCLANPREGEQVYLVWNEARKALQSTASTAEEGVYRYTARLYDRYLDPQKSTVVRERSRSRTGMSGTPFTTVPLQRLAERGYVETAGDSLLYHAPDAQALLSAAFMEQHCFRLADPKPGEEGLIGLAFEPVRGRRLPDIEGVLWLDRTSSELRRMEYRYTGLASRKAAEHAGGELEFRRLPGGRWIVGRWKIRMPELAVQRIAVGAALPGMDTRQASQWTLLGIKEEGGEVTTIATREGAPVVEERAGARLTGVVHDSTRAGGLPGVQVTLVGTGYAAPVDSAGRYELRDLPEGRYTVALRSPRLDSLGYVPQAVEVALARGGTVQRDFAVPPRVRILAAACADSVGPGRSALVGAVQREGTAEPLSGLRVTLTAGGQERQARTDSRGVYRFCGAPAAGEAILRVEAPGAAVRTAVSLGSGPTLQDFAVAPQPTPAPQAGRAAGGRVALTGRVVGGPERKPVAGATVRMAGAGQQTTDAQGRFTLRGVAPGSHAVTVAHPEHGTRTTQVSLDGGAADLELRLGAGTQVAALVTTPYTLDPLRVQARPERRSLANAGFYTRKEAGRGFFLTEKEFNRASQLSEVLRMVPGIRIRRYLPPPPSGSIQANPPAETRAASARNGPSTSLHGGPQDACFLPVFVDGVQVVSGSPRAGNDINDVKLTDVVAIEVYRSTAEIPAQIGVMDRTCGVILVWTQAEPDPS